MLLICVVITTAKMVSEGFCLFIYFWGYSRQTISQIGGPNLLKLEQFSCFQSVWNDIEYYRKDPHSLRDVMSRVRNMLGSIPIISTNYYTVYISYFSSNRETWRSQNNGRAIPVVCCDLSLQPIMYVIVSD
jgi:hypothetical protein